MNSYVTTSARRLASPAGYVSVTDAHPCAPRGYVTVPALPDAETRRPDAGSYICNDVRRFSRAA
jgi:hypothetical protein